MGWKKITSLLLAGAVIGAGTAPAAFAFIDSPFLDFPQHSPEYVLEKEETCYIQTNYNTSVEYEYNANGRLKQQTQRNQDGDVFEKIYSYDDSGRLIQIESDTATDIKLSYDENGDVVKTESIDGSGVYSVYSYDEKHHVTQIESHMAIPKGEIIKEVFANEYDDNDNLIKVSKTWVRDGKEESNGYYIYTYDEQNRRIQSDKHIQNLNGNDTVTSTIQYQYDINGNMVRSDVYVQNVHSSYTMYTYKKVGGNLNNEAVRPAVTKLFTDISEDWYIEPVQYVYDSGLMVGTSPTTFEPDLYMTRAMAIQLLYAKAGKPDVSGTGSYFDVAADEWYAKAAAWAVEKGIVRGYSDTEFGTNDHITREQLAVILYKDAGQPPVTGTLNGYPDYTLVSPWAENAVLWAVQQNIIQGTEQFLLEPQSGTTRAQAAAMIMQYTNK